MPDWWNSLLPEQPHADPPGARLMLRLIAYDIAHPRRLRRVADACLDFGVRLQKSVFECWLDDARFDELWARLKTEMKQDEDFVIAYTLDERAARARMSHGLRSPNEKKESYVL